MNTEIILATERINALGNNKLKVNLRSINSAGGRIEKDKWTIVKRMSDIVTNEQFVDDFATMSKFADFMKMPVSSLTKAVRAYSLHEMPVLEPLTLSKVEEFLPLEDGQIPVAIEMLEMEVTGGVECATVRQIREVVKIVKNPQTKEAEAEAEVETAEAETAEAEVETAEAEVETAEVETAVFTFREVRNMLIALGHSLDVVETCLEKLGDGEYEA